MGTTSIFSRAIAFAASLWLISCAGLAEAGPSAGVTLSPINGVTPGQSDLQEAIRLGGVVRLSFDGTITLTNTLEITNDVVLDGQGHSVTISGNNAVRLFHVTPGVSFSATNVIFANGRHIASSVDAGQPGLPGEGGAILSEGGVVQLMSCTFASNSVTGGTGGTGTTNATGAGRGGAIAALGGSLLLDSVTLSSNSAFGGLGVARPMDWPPSATMPDTSGDALGGAIFITNASARVVNCLLTNNLCSTLGGGSGASARGGAVFAGSGDLVFSNTWFTFNSAVGGNTTRSSSSSSYIGVQSSAQGGAVAALHGTVSFARCQILSNTAQGGDGEVLRAGGHGSAQGGGLFLGLSGREALLGVEDVPATLSCVDSTFFQNRALAGDYAASQGCGGALYINSLGFAKLAGCSFVSNSAAGSFGDYTAPANGMGGAIFNYNSLEMTNCTVALNLAQGGSATRLATPASAHGGGIYNVKGFKELGNVTAVNVTIASNYVRPGEYSTGAPGESYGANIANASGTVSLRNCILAYPLRSLSGFSMSVPPLVTWQNAWGSITDAGCNISSDGTAGFTNSSSRSSLDPLLLGANDNGGPTWTMSLATNSPAVDAGTAAGAPPTDQRGLPRPAGAGVDIGAYELQAFVDSTVVTTASQAALQEAIQQGGSVRLSFDGTIILTNTLEITKDVSLDAQDHSVTISGNNAVRLFHVNPGVSFSATNVIFANGRHIPPSADAGQPGVPGEGGAILSEGGVVQLMSCTFASNSVTGGLGGTGTTNATSDGRGGAIAALGGSLLLDSVTLSSNSALGGVGLPWVVDSYGGKMPGSYGDAFGGAIFITNASARFVNCILTNNFSGSGHWAWGGAVFAGSGDLVFSNSCFTSNSAVGDHIIRSPNSSLYWGGQGSARGGAFAALHGTVSFARCQILSNTAQGGDGDVLNSGRGSAEGGGLYLSREVFLGVENLPVTLSCVDSTFSQNRALAGVFAASQGCGGALYINCLGFAKFAGCSFLSNSVYGSADGTGGAIFNYNSLEMTNCTVALNLAQGGSARQLATPASAYGGGIYNVKGFKALGNVTAVNVTVASNYVMPGQYSTGAPGESYGANIANASGTVSLRNCILAYPLRSLIGFSSAYPPLVTWWNAWGRITDAGCNISSDGTAGFTNSSSRSSLDPLLLGANDNGGPTWTMALATNSPAIDAGTSVGAPATDQRGLPRLMGKGYDIGAFELQSIPTSIPMAALTKKPAGLHLGFDGQRGMTYSVRFSTDLINWTEVDRIGPFERDMPMDYALEINSEPTGFYRLFVP